MKLTIGEKIALLRKEKNATQTELAEYLFLTPQTVSRWEVGGGGPEITLLPKIAAFFGVSIDELFGVTDLERVENLVCKYSVLRDDRSFREAMECIDSQLQTIEALLKNSVGDTGELERGRDRLEGERMHMWIQQGREAFRRAFQIADVFVRKTEENPDHPWYLPMRLQRDQLCLHIARSREALEERRKELAERPSVTALQRYFYMLSDRQDYEAILNTLETKPLVGEIVFPPSKENLCVWEPLIDAAARTGRVDFVEQHLPPVLKVCGEQDEFSFLRCLWGLYSGEKQAAIKARLLTLLPGLSLNKYFEERTREEIEQRFQQSGTSPAHPGQG